MHHTTPHLHVPTRGVPRPGLQNRESLRAWMSQSRSDGAWWAFRASAMSGPRTRPGTTARLVCSRSFTFHWWLRAQPSLRFGRRCSAPDRRSDGARCRGSNTRPNNPGTPRALFATGPTLERCKIISKKNPRVCFEIIFTHIIFFTLFSMRDEPCHSQSSGVEQTFRGIAKRIR